MLAMQYSIALPSDYDMEIIRTRVRTRGAALDDRAGLGLKAYLVRERGVHGSAVNEYAPFYLWMSAEAMGAFLWDGGGFSGVVASFGRPRVEHGNVVAFTFGPACAHEPRAATRRVVALPNDADPEFPIKRARADLSRRAALPDVFATAIAVDPYRWQLVEFTLWSSDAPSGQGDRYSVLHLSAPELVSRA